MKREDIFKNFEQSFKNSKGRNSIEEVELSLKYHLNESYDLKEFIDFYKIDVKEYQERFAEERKNITKLITAISLTKTDMFEKIEKLPFLKTIDVFDKVNTIYFLYTKESDKKFQEIKKYYKNSNKIKIKGQLIDGEDISSMLKYLKGLVIDNKISKDDTLIDSSLGLKLTGIAMYKLAVEHGIKTVTWKDFQMPVYTKIDTEYEIDDSKNGKRVPLLAELKFMEEPTDENIRIYQAINNEIEKFNFHAVANYYRNMKMKDYSFFYDELGDLINLTNILEINSENFYEYISNFLERIFTHNFSEKIVVEKIRYIVLRLALLVDYKDIENPKFNFTNEEIEEEKDNLKKYKLNSKKMQEKLYYALILKYLFANSELSMLNEKISKSIFQIIFKDKNIDLDLDSDEYIEKLFANERDFDEIAEYLDFREILIEEEYNLVDLKGHTLYLRKFGIEIDLKNETNGVFKSNGNKCIPAIPIIKLLKDGNNTYDLRNLEGNEWTKPKFNQNKTKLKNEVMVNLNNLVRKKLRDRNYEEKDFIEEVFEGTGSAKKYSSFLKIEINSYFLDYK